MDLVSLQDDPFRELRSEEQLEALEHSTEGFDEEQAKQLYRDYAYDLNLDKAILDKVTDPKDADKRTLRNQKEYRSLWCSVMSRALVLDPHFQAAVLNEWQTPGLYDFSKLQLIEQSVLGIYFPLLYHLYDNLSDYLHDVEKNHELPIIVNDAVDTVKRVLNEKIVQRIHAKQRDSLDGKVVTLDPYIPKPAIPTLIALAQMEKRANQARGEVRKLFKELPGFMVSSSAQKLLEMYTPGSPGASSHIHDSLADSFANDIMKHMKKKTPILFNDAALKDAKLQPQKMPEDPELREHVSKATTLNDYLDEEIEEDVDTDEAAKDAAASKDKQVSFSIEQLEFDLAPEESELREEIERQSANEHIGFPGWKISENTLFQLDPLTDNKVEEGPPDASEGHATLSKIAQRSTSFIEGRTISDQQWKTAKAKPQTREDILQRSWTAFVSQLIDMNPWSASEEGGRDHKKNWVAATHEFAVVTERSAEAANAALDAAVFCTFTRVQLFDNWWHVRKYFQALQYYISDKTGKELASDHERDIMIVLVGIRCGFKEPLGGTLLLDFVLKGLWKDLLSMEAGDGPSELLKMLFDELTIFAYGTAVNAYVLRCPKASEQRGLMKAWYTQLRAWNPRCANPGCNRTLPKADKVTDAGIRGLFSMGTRQARVGLRGFRTIISNNRVQAFPCLYEILRCWLPCGTLVFIIFWFSHVYHDEVCKHHRGKLTITSF